MNSTEETHSKSTPKNIPALPNNGIKSTDINLFSPHSKFLTDSGGLNRTRRGTSPQTQLTGADNVTSQSSFRINSTTSKMYLNLPRLQSVKISDFRVQEDLRSRETWELRRKRSSVSVTRAVSFFKTAAPTTTSIVFHPGKR